jgi:DNA-binding ferritin-like protein
VEIHKRKEFADLTIIKESPNHPTQKEMVKRIIRDHETIIV